MRLRIECLYLSHFREMYIITIKVYKYEVYKCINDNTISPLEVLSDGRDGYDLFDHFSV